jgi:hypothetical protein
MSEGKGVHHGVGLTRDRKAGAIGVMVEPLKAVVGGNRLEPYSP